MRAEREIVYIPINKIRQNAYQPRKVFNQDSLIELSESIREFGVLQPISVRRIGEDLYELVAGERRLRASQLAGFTEIPAIVVNITDTESAVLALIENLQREDLNFIEEAEGYYNLIKEHGFTQEELAIRIGKKQSTIANKLRLLKLSDEVKQKLIKEGLTERHARALLKIDDEDIQKKVINEVVNKNLNVKKTEELIDRYSNKSNKYKIKESKPIAKYKWNINTKIIINTIKHIMEKNGIEATYGQNETDEHLEIIVRIPKK